MPAQAVISNRRVRMRAWEAHPKALKSDNGSYVVTYGLKLVLKTVMGIYA